MGMGVVVLGLAIGTITLWAAQPLALKSSVVDLSIEPGTSVRSISQLVANAGVNVSPTVLYYFLKLSGQSRQLRAGSYELIHPVSPWDLLQKLARGDENLKAVTLIEGWTFKQWRQALNQSEFIKHDTKNMSDTDIMALLGHQDVPPEGRFYPDTYTYGKGISDKELLRRSLKAMDQKLSDAWRQKDANLVLKDPDDALILASLIEKETGKASDRVFISSVFHNRLKIGMPLQTDPTVIYGMGEAFDGNLRRVDLHTDHSWNTYTRKGMPPTPIAMPGKQSLMAAVQPANSKSLYFVARGDGSSQFSDNLEDHNAAVQRFILKKNKTSSSQNN
ncbi:MAG: endolytic transglycosylase MltG [Limnohabitans sp.]|nr:endolytic transglycosylase MltG [Limnohabitans sp.]